MNSDIGFKQSVISMNMKVLYGVVLAFAFVIIMSFPVNADNTIQHVKIQLVTGIATVPANVNLTAPFNLTTPDGMNKTIYVDVVGDGYFQPNSTIFLWINNQTCKNANFIIPVDSYFVQQQAHFDCSNIITSQGTYNFTAMYSKVPSTLSTWIDIGYINKPNGEIKYIGGTDYWQGEKATIFVQLQDASGQSVNNASCTFNMYNTSSPLLSPIFSNQPLVFIGTNGIYYYQFITTGYPEGVYPIDAQCTYIYDNFYFYDGVLQTINVTTNSGTFGGGSATDLNSYSDGLYNEWTSTPNVTFRWNNITTNGNVTRLDLYWLGETSTSRTITFYAFNYTSSSYNINLGSVTTNGGGGTSAPTGVDDIFTATVPSAAYNGTTVSIQMVSNGAGTLFLNWITLKAYQNSSLVTEVKGSSEVHIYSLNITNDIINTFTLATFINGTVNQINTTTIQNQNLLNNLSANLTSGIWSYQARTLTDYNNTLIYGNTQTIIALLNGLSNLTAQQVWNYTGGRNLTFIDWQTGALYVWNSTSRTLTDYNLTGISANMNTMNNTLNSISTSLSSNFTNIFNNFTVIPANVWASASRTLSDYNNSVIFANTQTTIALLNGMSNLTAAQVWNYTGGRNLTFIDWQTGALFVWNSTSRNLTYYAPVSVNSTNIALNVWNSTTRTLTDYNLTGISGNMNTMNNTLNAISSSLSSNFTNIFNNFTVVPANVWLATTRTLTDYNNSVIFANTQTVIGILNGMSNLTAEQVWNYTGGRNLTFVDWQTGALFVWNSTSRNLTYYAPASVNSTDIANNVWNSTTRTLTYYNLSGISGNQSIIISNQGVINATANRIEANTIQINSTVNSISSYLANTIYPLMLTMNNTITAIQGTLNTVANNVVTILGLSNQIYNNTLEINATVSQMNSTINNISSNVNSIPQAVWNATSRNLTYYQPVDPSLIWNYPVRNLTFFDYQTQALFVWNSTDRNLTFYPTVNTTVNSTDIAQAVWNYTSLNGRTLTDYNLTQLLAYLVQINSTTIQISNTTNDTLNLLVAINGSLVPNTVYIY